ncbi:ComF family protein [Bacillus sp. DNRA2]|uniref:ComF family protein n=1 Tax=Bacillus sp. DNRA2 TaxID=2723053 RepID=UPI0032B83C4F
MMKTLFHNPRCAICHDEISHQIGWVQLFSVEAATPICQTCQEKFEEITGETCRICGRSFENGEYLYKTGELCFDCIRWEETPEWSGLLERNTSIFHYNDFLKETLARFKFRGDYVIVHAFSLFLKRKLTELKPNLFVPIPLSEERLYERGFNQAEALIKESGFTPTCLLTRLHAEKQSKKSRWERIHLDQVFSLNHVDVDVKNQNILLVDDIYTTGSTLRHAAKVLKEAGAASISSLTLARG